MSERKAGAVCQMGDDTLAQSRTVVTDIGLDLGWIGIERM